MAMMRRRGGFRRRAKKRYLWTGIQVRGATVADSGSKTIVELVTPAQVSTVADLLVERVVIDWKLVSTIAGRNWAFYIDTVQTDVAEVPVSAALWDPLSTDIDAVQKRPMHWRAGQLSNGAVVGTANGVMLTDPLDINVKRKLAGDNALVFVVSATGTGVALDLFARVLLSVGRK